MRNALQKQQMESRAGFFKRHRALTELVGWAGFPAELLNPGIEGHLVASTPPFTKALKVELGSAQWQQFGVHPDA